MNLVAKEYVATRHDKTGVLVLSEMAGASKELPEAIIINPNNREEIAEALKTALECLARNKCGETLSCKTGCAVMMLPVGPWIFGRLAFHRSCR